VGRWQTRDWNSRGEPVDSLVTNDNWGTQSANAAANTTALQTLQQATARAGAFALANNSQDAAGRSHLGPWNYTVQAKGPNANASGVVLLEVYDVTTGNGGPKAANVSTRAQVGTGNNILIAGFVDKWPGLAPSPDPRRRSDAAQLRPPGQSSAGGS
jgi:hypothetical protein